MFNRTGETTAEIKVYHQNDWVWLDISFQAQDLDKRGLLDKDGNWIGSSAIPSSSARGNSTLLGFAYQKNIELHDTPLASQRICAVDMGLTNSAVCAILDANGTVIARTFINGKR